jgi:hypothetical protein
MQQLPQQQYNDGLLMLCSNPDYRHSLVPTFSMSRGALSTVRMVYLLWRR